MEIDSVFTTPPSPLIALIGVPSVHEQLKANFEEESRCVSWTVDNVGQKETEKRPTYEGYVPSGILKTRWLTKFLHQAPAVYVLLHEVGNEADLRAKEGEIIQTLESVRNAKRKSARVVVVLVTRDPMPDDKIAQTRKKVEIESRNFLQFSTADPKASGKKIEKVIFENADQAYKDEAKRIKKQRDKLSKATQMYLFIRHHFKIAFLGEFRRDVKTCLKHYSSGYTLLREVAAAAARDPLLADRSKDCGAASDRVMEITTVAEIFTSRLLSLYVSNGMLDEARDLFRRHMLLSRAMPPDRTMQFLHFASISRQYLNFGNMLVNGPASSATSPHRGNAASLASSQRDAWYHPGFYFHNAASNIDRRRQAAAGLLKDLPPASNAAPEPLEQCVYVGQIVPSALPPDDYNYMKQRQLRALLGMEHKIDYSAIILDTLGKTCEHYLRRQQSRLHIYLARAISREHMSLGQYDNARRVLHGLVHILADNGWTMLHADVMESIMICSRHLQLVPDFVQSALHLLAADVPLSAERKGELQAVIANIFGLPPPPQLALTQGDATDSEEKKKQQSAKDEIAKNKNESVESENNNNKGDVEADGEKKNEVAVGEEGNADPNKSEGGGEGGEGNTILDHPLSENYFAAAPAFEAIHRPILSEAEKRAEMATIRDVSWIEIASPIEIDLEHKNRYLAIKGHFHAPTVLRNADLKFSLSIVAHVALPLPAAKIIVTFNDASYNRTLLPLALESSHPHSPSTIFTDLILPAEREFRYTFSLPSDKLQTLEYLACEVHIGGDDARRSLIFKTKTPERIRAIQRDTIQTHVVTSNSSSSAGHAVSASITPAAAAAPPLPPPSSSSSHPPPPSGSLFSLSSLLFEEERAVCIILAGTPQAKIDVEMLPPALEGEYFDVVGHVDSNGDAMLTPAVALAVSSSHHISASSSSVSGGKLGGGGGGGGGGDLVKFFLKTGEGERRPLGEGEKISLNDVMEGEDRKEKICFQLYATRVGTVSLDLTLTYETRAGAKCLVSKQISVEISSPFRLHLEFLSPHPSLLASTLTAAGGEEGVHMEINKRVVVNVSIESTSPHPLLLSPPRLRLLPPFARFPREISSSDANPTRATTPSDGENDEEEVSMPEEERAMEGGEGVGKEISLSMGERWFVHFVCEPTMGGREIIFGSLFLQWRRQNADVGGEVYPGETIVPLPPASVFEPAIRIDSYPPPTGSLGHPLPLVLSLKNAGNVAEEVRIAGGNSEAFLFSGYKQAVLVLHPRSETRVSYVLLPIVPGHVALPHIHLQ